MKIVSHSIPIGDFKKTNGPWNVLKLNAPWSVGYTSGLFLSRSFQDYLSWQSYYFKTGYMRKKRLEQYPRDIQSIANALQDHPDHPEVVRQYPALSDINMKYGRTRMQLKSKGIDLYNYMVRQGIKIDSRYCEEAVFYRVLGETWNGMGREQQCFDQIRALFPMVKIVKVEPSFDHQYAVDGMLYKEDKLICAIQIKPHSYLGKSPYILKAKRSNIRKTEKFTEKYKVDVIELYYNDHGTIHGQSFQPIQDLL